MDEITLWIDKLNKLKDTLLSMVQSVDNRDSLSVKLIELVGRDPESSEIYQLILLANSNLETDQKSFKKDISNIINDIISSKIFTLQTIQKLDSRIKKVECETDSNKGFTLPYFGLIKPKDVIVFVLVALVTVSSLVHDEGALNGLTQIVVKLLAKG